MSAYDDKQLRKALLAIKEFAQEHECKTDTGEEWGTVLCGRVLRSLLQENKKSINRPGRDAQKAAGYQPKRGRPRSEKAKQLPQTPMKKVAPGLAQSSGSTTLASTNLNRGTIRRPETNQNPSDVQISGQSDLGSEVLLGPQDTARPKISRVCLDIP